MAAVVIVGAGLFGSIAAKVARAHGHNVIVIDDGRTMSGSDAAACLLKPSWASKLGSQTWTEGMQVLELYYNVKVLKFRTGLMNVHIDIAWVDPKTILLAEDRSETVIKVGDGVVETSVEGNVYEGNVLIATGVWANYLASGIEQIRPKVGAAIIYNHEIEEPRISVYAPYKQAVSFVRDPGTTWFGDGTAILLKNWDSSRITDIEQRARKWHGLGPERVKRVIVGQRPFTSSPQGVFKQISPKTWVVTGGGKNGTILAAYYAQKFVEAIS